MSDIKEYLVEVPQRATQTFLVKANSAKEARSLVDAHGPFHDQVDAIDNTVTWHGKARTRGRAP